MPVVSAVNAAKYRDKPRAIAAHLNDALSTGDLALITMAIGDMVRAQGMSRFSQRSGMERTNLYKSFRGKSNPRVETLLKVLIALDVQLMVKAKGK